MNVTVRTINRSLDPKPIGAGDVVAAVAQPIAAVIDWALWTDILNCSSCEERRKKWNKMMPNILRPLQK